MMQLVDIFKRLEAMDELRRAIKSTEGTFYHLELYGDQSGSLWRGKQEIEVFTTIAQLRVILKHEQARLEALANGS